MKNILVNLWYSYLSRRLWETPKGSYGIIPHYEYNYTLFSYMIAFVCVGSVKHFLFTIKGHVFDELINKGMLFFFQETWFIFISFLLVIYYFIILNEFILTGTTVKRWYVEQYAKMKTKKEAIKEQSENKSRKGNIFKIFNLFRRKGIVNYSFGNIRRCCLEKTRQQICKFFSVTCVTDRKNVSNSPRNIKKGEYEQKQYNVVIHGSNGKKPEKDGENKIKDYPAGVYQEFGEIVSRTQPPALEAALTPNRKSPGDENFSEENGKLNQTAFFGVTNNYFCRGAVKQDKEKNMAQFMNKQGGDIGRKCKQDSAYSKSRVIQNKDLLSEYTRKERMLLWATVTVWAPLALIDGGLRPARLLVQAPYNKWIGFVDSICLYLILCLHGLFFAWLLYFFIERG